MKPNWDNEPPLYRVGWGFLGAIIGSFFVFFLNTRELRVMPANVSYADLAAVALTSVTVILAVFGLIIAIAAIYGYRQFMRIAASKAEDEARKTAAEEVKNAMATGETRLFLKDQAVQVAMETLSAASLEQIIREQVTRVVMGDPEDDVLDREESEEAPKGDKDK